jgi:hypothetical protein
MVAPSGCECLFTKLHSLILTTQTFAIFWTLVGLLAIVICVLVIAKDGRNSGAYVFGNFEPQSGWPDGWAFCVGLLQAAYATSSTGMVISCVPLLKIISIPNTKLT